MPSMHAPVTHIQACRRGSPRPGETHRRAAQWALVPFDVDPSLRVGCPAACGGGGHFPARLEPFLGELLSPSTCIPPHAAQRLCFNVLLSPNAKVVPAREHPDPLQPSCRAMVLMSV